MKLTVRYGRRASDTEALLILPVSVKNAFDYLVGNCVIDLNVPHAFVIGRMATICDSCDHTDANAIHDIDGLGAWPTFRSIGLQ